MKVRLPTKFFVAICLCLSANVDIRAQASPPVQATIEHADITLNPNGLTIEIVLSAPFLPQGVALTNPDRLVFDFPGFTLRAGNRQMQVNNGPVRKFRAALFQSDPPIARIVIDLKEPVKFEVKSAGNNVLIEIPFSMASSRPAAAPPSESKDNGKEACRDSRPGRPGCGATLKADQPPLGVSADRSSAPMIAAPTPASNTTAYKLQDKAKALKLQDLENSRTRQTRATLKQKPCLPLPCTQALC